MYTVITYSLGPPQQWRGCLLLSGGERTSPAPVPSAAVPKKPETGTRKPELGFTMRLGTQPIICARRSPLENFSLHLSSGRAAFSSPAI
ncbi:unnamed protein product, partial [Staurois parvus]